jgi:hypothetical protein
MIAELWLRWWPVIRGKWPVLLAFAAGWILGAWLMPVNRAPRIWVEQGWTFAQDGRRWWALDPKTGQWVELQQVPK